MMNEEDKQILLAKLDWFESLSTCIISYFRRHDNVSFDIAREMYSITKVQLETFIREHYTEIWDDEEIYNYYECVIREFEFIDNNIATYRESTMKANYNYLLLATGIIFLIAFIGMMTLPVLFMALPIITLLAVLFVWTADVKLTLTDNNTKENENER